MNFFIIDIFANNERNFSLNSDLYYYKKHPPPPSGVFLWGNILSQLLLSWKASDRIESLSFCAGIGGGCPPLPGLSLARYIS
jgi:hypothetical protein